VFCGFYCSPYPRGDQLDPFILYPLSLYPLADPHLKSLVYGTNHEFRIVSLEYQKLPMLRCLDAYIRVACWQSSCTLESDTRCQHTHHTSIINSSPDVPSEVIRVSSWRPPQSRTRPPLHQQQQSKVLAATLSLTNVWEEGHVCDA